MKEITTKLLVELSKMATARFCKQLNQEKTLVESEINNFTIEKFVLFHHGFGYEPVHSTCF